MNETRTFTHTVAGFIAGYVLGCLVFLTLLR